MASSSVAAANAGQLECVDEDASQLWRSPTYDRRSKSAICCDSKRDQEGRQCKRCGSCLGPVLGRSSSMREGIHRSLGCGWQAHGRSADVRDAVGPNPLEMTLRLQAAEDLLGLARDETRPVDEAADEGDEDD